MRSCRAENTNECFLSGWDNVLIRNKHRNISVSESCVIAEQYFDLTGRLVRAAGMVILLSLK